MRKISLYIIFNICIFLSFSGCSKDSKSSKLFGENVEIYLLESFETIEGSRQIKDENLIIAETPCIYYSDLMSYNAITHSFALTEDSKGKIMDTQFPVSGTAFAVMANNELIYTGYFWPSYSSISCDWTTIDPLHLYSGNELQVVLGYPIPSGVNSIPDKRNDSRILAIFRRDHKLIE